MWLNKYQKTVAKRSVKNKEKIEHKTAKLIDSESPKIDEFNDQKQRTMNYEPQFRVENQFKNLSTIHFHN